MADDLRFTISEAVDLVMAVRNMFLVEMRNHGVSPDDVETINEAVRNQIRMSIVKELENILEI